MKRLISWMMPLPSTRKGMATVSSTKSVGKEWKVAAGALAWTEMQMAQGLETLALATECAWVASTPVISKTSKTQLCASQRRRLLFANWLLLITHTL